MGAFYSSPMRPTPSPQTQHLIALANAAGRAIMQVYATDFAAKTKADQSPVTEADEAAERIILAGLAKLNIPVISEEAAAAGRIPAVADHFFLVDPLDGTKEFISRNGEFTVNIAEIKQGVPVAGVVFAPARQRLFWGELGKGAAEGETHIRVRTPSPDGATVVASRSHRDAATDEYLSKIKVKSLCSAGSSLKFCLIAAGEADLYPRFGRTMEWDTAAGQAILLSAGGKVLTLDGNPLSYGKRDQGYANPSFIASA